MINKDTQLCMSLSGRPGNFGTLFHNYLYQKLGLNFIYKAFTTQDIEHAVKGVRALGIRGCAVSMPFKESCIAFLDELSASAKAIDSVNTIVNDNGYLKAYNTDYIAIAKLIEKYQLNPKSSVIVHGSGGMAKAVVAAFKDAGFKMLSVCSRNPQTGKQLAELYGYQYMASLKQAKADIIVNVTPIGMTGGKEATELSFPLAMIEQATTAFDVVALPAETPLITTAQKLGKQTISGAEVIVLQAVEQFELYTGKRPDEELIAEASAFARAHA
ncbi:shikimate 5-dehydrogenase [Testudinibacter sp. TR-2022]|uniref:shikimate 5-dehydrogenase n=1 Tax=Testudinibacter sp. TR-2022 TaxID=2585029 RepID=UPI001117BDF0|nr:shikimate 5-dehydrogenase [Testudinibacter sp. TR-2022]TNH01980.1 shikimate 5-dehydrogenase [Pasteurellaceae bacterium Phil31]TNH04896.1 shikimate 5-dehydrogenase [Testudinibacter sp. TR-2022]TNH09932.1 shikimate 5-dehydrogenase [Testudinibacter sp. TR-2022]TNH14443.1 shikimate 5-dehydrogenase [Testudinibacter sp. TR-2022]TNH17058.1 shikimate 5-dehydrogenase [Testudinibacter sp. TR-2022]